MKYETSIYINNREISINSPTYFIADIASNHDNDINRAKELIYIAKESGADAAKFQHFKAEKIVSDYGFKNLGNQLSHQSKWEKSVFEVYKENEFNREWTEDLSKTAKEVGIDFFSSPYDEEALELLDKLVPAYKIGSGDITWLEIIKKISQKNKPVIIATGASDINEVEKAIQEILKYNKQIVLMQCNTNYTGSNHNFKYINLNVLKTFSVKYPNMILGLSDHTPGHTTVIGAITLGARVIEKHFTDNNNRKGPDHPFSMNPKTWKEMVIQSRFLEESLGDGIKRVEKNEEETIVLQRRCLRLKNDMVKGEKINLDSLESLRPSPINSFFPFQLDEVIGKTLNKDKVKGDALFFNDIN